MREMRRAPVLLGPSVLFGGQHEADLGGDELRRHGDLESGGGVGEQDVGLARHRGPVARQRPRHLLVRGALVGARKSLDRLAPLRLTSFVGIREAIRSGMARLDLPASCQVLCEPGDIVLVAGFVSHLELDWADPRHASFLDRLPGSRTHYPKLLPLMNLAFESFDLSGFDRRAPLAARLAWASTGPLQSPARSGRRCSTAGSTTPTCSAGRAGAGWRCLPRGRSSTSPRAPPARRGVPRGPPCRAAAPP